MAFHHDFKATWQQSLATTKAIKPHAVNEFKQHRGFYLMLLIPTYVALILNQWLFVTNLSSYRLFLQQMTDHANRLALTSQTTQSQHGSFWAWLASILLLSASFAILNILRQLNYQRPLSQSMTLFAHRSTIINAFRVGVANFVMMFAWTALSFIIATVLLVIAFKLNVGLGLLVMILVVVMAFWFLTYKQLQYSQAQLLVFDDQQPVHTGFAALQLSSNVMRGHVFELFWLQLSFIGWWILNVITFGLVGYFFLRPYLQITLVKYYQQLTN